MKGVAWRSPRCWAALLLLIAAWFDLPVVESAVYRPLAHSLQMHMIQHSAMALGPYAWLMVVRAALDFALLSAIQLLLGKQLFTFPLTDIRLKRHLALGLGVGMAGHDRSHPGHSRLR